ncbi:ribosomal RNA large subunit methyltransferase J [Nostoc sp. NIES-4103]|nr:ribosomal RNA large subunit methyltransferase J [Nostoc sp. NIES-4103]
MSYKHFGRIGDIWKHIPLCEFLAIEKPASYIETNSAYPEYQLTGSLEQEYGILYVEKNIHKSSLIQNSVYWKVLNSIFENHHGISKYLGSPALALNILGTLTEKFVFFDIEEACLKNIEEYAQKLNLTSQIFYKNEDLIDGLLNLIEELSIEDFIHVDPYLIHEKNTNGNTYFDAFVKAMRKGVKGMLWYGFNTSKERNDLHQGFQGLTNTSSISLQGIEIMSILLDKNILDVNPGLWGCGIMIGNLSDVSSQYFKQIVLEVIKIYQGSTIFNKYLGELKFEDFQIPI